VGASGDVRSELRRRWLGRFPVALVLAVGVATLSIVAYVTLQRGPIRVLDCFIADDFFVDVEEPGTTLGAFRASVRHDTRNCVAVRVVSGPTDDDAIVTSPTETKWMFYRGDYTIEVQTVSG